MRSLFVAAALGTCLLVPQTVSAQPPKAEKGGHTSAAAVAAATYEHLANVIIEIKAAEDQLVKSILIGYHQSAQTQLRAAMREGGRRAAALEAAAANVSNIANEGDKRIQSIRQRLSKAGHTHNTDAETKGDYMFVTNKEKKGLVDLAGRIAKTGADAKPADIEALAKELASLFEAAIAPE